VSEIPERASRLLEAGEFCYVAASTPSGPHVTPMVFAFAGERLWVTTSRGSVKARAWRDDPRVAALVRVGADALMFTGTATTHDALDPRSWRRSLSEAPVLAVASARFTRKNARFFAGYAFDARRVPFAWTPPGRVFAELEIERTALAETDRVRTSGEWRSGVASRERFRASRTGRAAFDALPERVRDAVGTMGAGALAVDGADGPTVVPARWTVDGAALYAVSSERTLALAGVTSASVPVALCIDRPSTWRAREMVGAMARGEGEIHVLDRVQSGETSARAVVHAAGAEGDAVVVRVRPRRFVWWQGWESGTVSAA
jgi:nitroimidazol reductase NimA-like FMN-containing flavoprotein (pyridoxamine 5'-phosphate oxidase superfamily)